MDRYETKMKEQRDEIKENLKKKDYVLTVYEDGDYAWGDMANPKVTRSYAVCSLEEIPEYIEKMKTGFWTHPDLENDLIDDDDIPFVEKKFGIHTNILIEPLTEEMEKNYIGSSKLGFFESMRYIKKEEKTHMKEKNNE